ncbi:uncharacterized protein L201_002970 [Kwoniella dendrophila CBS 6074]|uniref:Uncharacterized protein n=1 Tax=Kwoniella dendrophila CBS 6074 TaxID=1295534 RepID=A0AAX4JRN7_9TREE
MAKDNTKQQNVSKFNELMSSKDMGQGQKANKQNPGQNQSRSKDKEKQQDNFPVVPQKDIYQRINFSYQASIFLQSLGTEASSSSSSSNPKSILNTKISDVTTKIDRKGKRKAIENNINLNHQREEEEMVNGKSSNEMGYSDIATKTRSKFRQLARMSIREMNGMIVHNQLKLDPSLKRSLCKSCGTVLVPGLTSRIRNKPNSNSFSITHHTCLTCSTSFSIPAPPLPLNIDIDGNLQIDKEGLDGKIRRSKRQKIAKRSKKIFHEIEKTNNNNNNSQMSESSDTKINGIESGGHTLWKGDQRLEGWGIKN